MKNIKCSTTLVLYVLYLVNIVHVFCTDILQNNLSPTYRCLIFFTNTIENNALGDSKLACVSESYGEVEGLSQLSTTMIGKEVLEMENRAATCMLSPPGKMRCSHGSDRIRRNTVVSKRCPLRPQHQVEAVKASAAFGCSEEVGDQKLYFSSTRWNSSCSTRGTFRRRLPGSFASPRILDGLLRVSAMLVCLSALGEGLVILEPFQTTFQHVPADFGPNVLTVEPPIESRPLVGARPRDACAPLRNRWQMARGAIALIERGNCNFTEKVRNAQSAGASAVVVTDNNTENTSHKTMTTMSGEPEYTRDVNIPSVLVTYTDGQRLWARRSRWSGGDRIVASVNAKGHLRPPTIGALETLGVYILVSMILIGFSVICGVVVALAVSWYQRGYRARAMRRLKTFVFERSVGCSANGRSSVTGDASGAQAAAFSTTPRQNSTEAAAAESQDPAPRRQQDGADAGGGAAEKSGEGCNGLQAGDDMCAICLELYEVGDKLTALPCHHSFHTDCIKPWLSGKSGVCPMCKREAFSPRGKFLSSMAPRIEATLEELRALCTDNLLVLGVFFLASVACGVVAANMSVRD